MSPLDLGMDEAEEATVSRRHILAVGGFSIAAAALVAACAPDKPKPQVPQAGVAPSTTALPEQNVSDEVLLRTSSSLERTLNDAYATVVGLGTLPADAASIVRTFATNHSAHATFFDKTTADLGGEPFTEANAPLQKNIIDPALKAIADAGNDPADLLWFVYGLENVAAGTLQSFVPLLDVPALRSQVMSVGGADARHAAIAARLLPTATVVALSPEDAAAATTTTTAIAGATTTTTPANEAVQVSQVPGSFAPLTPVAVAIGGVEEAWNLLGPNSYEYLPATPA